MSNIQKVMDMKECPVSGKTSEYSFPNILLVIMVIYNPFILSNFVLGNRVWIEQSPCD